MPASATSIEVTALCNVHRFFSSLLKLRKIKNRKIFEHDILANSDTQNKKSGLYLASHYHIPTYFGSLNTNLYSENLHHPPDLAESPKKLQNPENRQEQFLFKKRYITFIHLCHRIPIYLYLLNMILTLMKIYNP